MPKPPVAIDPETFALILVDLQNGVLGMPVAPHSAADVVAASQRLADYFRQIGAPVVLINLAFPGQTAAPPTDMGTPPMPEQMPPGWDDIVAALGGHDTDIRITKHSWGAFTATALDSELRARKVTTLVLAGIATNIGVEQTARQALELGYAVVFASDAMSSISEHHHNFALDRVLPLIGRVRTVSELLE
jgi:nicotinamidase-related amidase